jgi:hypothetical protein
MSDEPKDLYVSAVPGHLVARHGTGSLIGASRDSRDPSKVTWDTELVVKIPEDEARRFAKEYARSLREGALKARSKPEFEACNAKLEAKAGEDKVKADAEKAKAEVDAATAARKSGKKE